MPPPREATLGALAAGPAAAFRFPFEGLAAGVLHVIESAIAHAWAVLRLRVGNAIDTAVEVEITAALQLILNEFLNDASEPVAGFTARTFETVERGAEVVNFDGSRLEKRPDLRFRLIGVHSAHDRVHHALFVECKIIDATHPVRSYCDEGLVRFINGTYAWAMPHAMMLGYVRDGSTIESLREHLRKNSIAYSLLALLGSERVSVDERTSHARAWIHPSTDTAPGPIDVLHIWLNAN